MLVEAAPPEAVLCPGHFSQGAPGAGAGKARIACASRWAHCADREDYCNLADSDTIEPAHLTEAIHYRSLDRRMEG